MRRHGRQVVVGEAHGTQFHGAVRIDQKNGRYVGQSIRVGNQVAVFVVDQDRKRYAIFLRKTCGGPDVVLGNPQKGHAVAAVTSIKTLEKRESKLAERAGNFEES